MFGAGMSKLGLNSSPCWRDLTCTTTHYLTQPFPNPLSLFMSNLPLSFHMAEVVVNHVCELVLPFLLLLPFARRVRNAAAACSIGYMFCLMATGNYAFIQTITCVPLIVCLDDEFFGRKEEDLRTVNLNLEKAFQAVVLVCGLFILFQSGAPIKELASPSPW